MEFYAEWNNLLGTGRLISIGVILLKSLIYPVTCSFVESADCERERRCIVGLVSETRFKTCIGSTLVNYGLGDYLDLDFGVKPILFRIDS